ncbi:hypothetical protein [Arthrobacter sp. YC-RL1]|uniref:hypothetical protein n=1 Tax=Arthrobacter sp. YC-RL1 TaxID=1652545 RepID=UPI000AA5CB0B|nr:hypothetical protein [Arthrobacter sp. YC-RL1]
MELTALLSPNLPEGERRLTAFGLSTELIHTALRPGLSRAANRSSLALRSTPGTDIYHESMLQLHQILSPSGWRLVYVEQQPRLVHPDGLISLTIASGQNVAHPDRRRKPRTRRKGKSTRASLAAPNTQMPALFDIPATAITQYPTSAVADSPLWLLVHERTERGLNLELSRPMDMTESGIVTDWKDRIIIDFLDLDGDLSVFDHPEDGSIDVAVQPL